jgi:hypothetical protein
MVCEGHDNSGVQEVHTRQEKDVVPDKVIDGIKPSSEASRFPPIVVFCNDIP